MYLKLPHKVEAEGYVHSTVLTMLSSGRRYETKKKAAIDLLCKSNVKLIIAALFFITYTSRPICGDGRGIFVYFPCIVTK